MSSLVIRQSLVPMVVFFIVIMVVLAVGLRMSRREARQESARRPVLIKAKAGWPQLIVHYATTAVGGYLLLMAVCLIYYFGVARVGGNFIESAVTGCALLMGLSAPVFFLVSWLTARRN
jgi:hypothetical protein